MSEEKTLNEKIKELANTILGTVQSNEDEGNSDGSSVDPGAEDKALEPNTEGVEGAEDAQPSISSEELVGLLSEVNEQLKARDEQVNALTETVRLLIKAGPVDKTEDSSAKASAPAMDASSKPFANLNLRR